MGKKSFGKICIAVGVALAVFLVLVVVLVIIFTTQDQVSYTNNGDGTVETTESVSCESDEVKYPFFVNDATGARNLKINVIMGDGKLSKVSLIYRLGYDGEKTIEQMATNFDIAMNKAFSEDGLGNDAFGASFARLKDAVQMNLYAEAGEINGVTAKYFLLDDQNGYYTTENITKGYTKKGFDCIINK